MQSTINHPSMTRLVINEKEKNRRAITSRKLLSKRAESAVRGGMKKRQFRIQLFTNFPLGASALNQLETERNNKSFFLF